MIGDEDELSIDDSMRETFREIESRDEVGEPEVTIEPVDDSPADEALQDEAPTETEDTTRTDETGRIRDEKGRFAAKEKEVGEVGSPEAEVQPEPVAETQPEPEAPADPTLANAPGTWTPEAKSLWKDVSPRIKQEILKRESDMVRGVQNLNQAAAFGNRMNQAVQPYMPLINSKNSTPEKTVQGMLNVAYQLEQGTPHDKVQMLMSMAQDRGVLNELVARCQQNGQNVQQSTQLDPLRQDVAQLKQMIEQRDVAEQQTATTQAVTSMTEFANEVGDDGVLSHPYFQNVRQEMAHFLRNGLVSTFQDAYDRATWANPEIRKILQSQQVSSVQTEQQEAAKARADKARKAQTVNLSKSGTHDADTPDGPTGTVEDTMKETMNNIRSRSG